MFLSPHRKYGSDEDDDDEEIEVEDVEIIEEEEEKPNKKKFNKPLYYDEPKKLLPPKDKPTPVEYYDPSDDIPVMNTDEEIPLYDFVSDDDSSRNKRNDRGEERSIELPDFGDGFPLKGMKILE